MKQNVTQHTRCGYEVPGMTLLRDSKEAKCLYRSKYMSMHVSACTRYDLDALTSVWGGCGTDKTCIVSTSRRKNE
jgi:hypothetical protein